MTRSTRGLSATAELLVLISCDHFKRTQHVLINAALGI